MLRKFSFAVSILLSSCATLDQSPHYAVKITNVDWPLSDLQKLVAFEMPTGLRSTSPNGREFYSKYYILATDSYKPAGEAIDRYYAQITVLGDRRPYDLEIFVTREKRVLRGNRFDYITVGHDVDLARELEFKIHDELNKRREERNVIDDFRVF